MCEICGRYRCPSGCPNAPEPAIYGYCEECGEEIYDGEDCYKIGGHIFCESCVSDGHIEAEVSDE